jgi:hypothetical protein
MTRYEFFPLVCNRSQWILGVDDPQDVWSKAGYTAEEWAEILGGYQFVYIGKADALFWSRYGSLFTDVQASHGSKLFRVEHTDENGIRLIPLEMRLK